MKIDKAIKILNEHLSKIKTMEKLTSNNYFVIESGQQDLDKAIEIVLKALDNAYEKGFKDGHKKGYYDGYHEGGQEATNDILGRF